MRCRLVLQRDHIPCKLLYRVAGLGVCLGVGMCQCVPGHWVGGRVYFGRAWCIGLDVKFSVKIWLDSIVGWDYFTVKISMVWKRLAMDRAGNTAQKMKFSINPFSIVSRDIQIVVFLSSPLFSLSSIALEDGRR